MFGLVQSRTPIEQTKEDWIIDTSLIHLMKPFRPSDHIGPKVIIKEEVQEDIPLPSVANDGLIVWLILFYDPMEGVLDNLSISVSIPSRGTKREITS